MMRARAHRLVPLAAAALLLGAASPTASVMYVVEQLVVQVNGAADFGGERVATLKSGDRVEVIERNGEAVHVRLASGRDGWLRASYLSAEEPLRLQLQQSSAEATRLKAEVNRLQTQLDASSSMRAAAPAAVPPEEPSGGGALFPSAREAAPVRLWPWVLLTAVLALAAGFALGWYMLDRTIRRKYGGLKIY
jgi:hypothetical protein